MTYQSTLEDPGRDTNTFYRRTLHVLSDAHVRFLVGGSHAYLQYTGIVRPTKDFDLFLRREDIEPALDALRDAGYRTEIAFPHWLAKAHQSGDHVDLVFSSGNGLCHVDDEWFAHAIDADVLGMPVKIAPVEEFLWQKAFVMERERFDGADVNHLLRAVGTTLDWDRLLWRFDRHWEELLAHVMFFRFAYPCERRNVPDRVMTELLSRTVGTLREGNGPRRECRGNLLSKVNYQLDLDAWVYADGRRLDEEERLDRGRA